MVVEARKKNQISLEHLQQFPIFSSQNLLFANSPNMYGEAKKNPSPIVPYCYSQK